MPIQILATKRFIPPLRQTHITRPKLLERFANEGTGKLTLISAPAGYGKTTFITEWIDQTDLPFGWLSLGPEDNDLRRFLAYFSAALGTVEAGLSEDIHSALISSDQSDPNLLLVRLLNKVAEGTDPFSIVLDDYHLIHSQEIHEALTYILENMPPRMHLVIATRVDPPLALARLRARGELREIRAKDLEFSLEESTAFLNGQMALGLSPKNILALDNRTEGWVAGLQMAAISLRGHEDVESFIRAFAGSNRFIFDYLIEEVLDSQLPEIQEFMLRTSILDRFCAPLCEALTGIDDCQSILHQFEERNMFITPLDDQRRWYRWHHLFGDILDQRLKQKYPDQIEVLHQKACDWFYQNGLLADAFHHALAIGDFDTIASLIESHVFDAVERQELATLSNWLERLPVDLIQARPWLNLAYAWVLEETTRLDQVNQYLDRAEGALTASPDLPPGERSHLESCIYALRAKMGLRNRQFKHAAAYAQKSLDLVPQGGMRLRGFVAHLLGSALWSQGNLGGAARAFEAGIAASSTAEDLNNTIKIYGDLAGLYAQSGQLHQANAACREALGIVDQYALDGGRVPRAASYIHFRLSQILAQWNDLTGSLRHAQRSEAINQTWGLETRATYLNLAGAYQLTGDFEESEFALKRAEEIASKGSEHWILDVDITRAALALARGDRQAAYDWAEHSGLTLHDTITYQNLNLYLVYAQIMASRAVQVEDVQINDLGTLLSKLYVLINRSGAARDKIIVLTLQALVSQVQGHTAVALDKITEAIELGEPGGFIRIFFQGGEPIARLIYQVSLHGIHPDYCSQILSHLSDSQQETKTHKDEFVDALTPRELEVLANIARGCTNQEIAQELVLSLYTVKSHVRNIFSKLGVKNRIEAVTKARLLGLLTED